jgi:hypothetical protein
VAQRVAAVLDSQNPWYSAREGGEGYNVEVKVKIYPVTGHKDPEERVRCNSILSLILALDGEGGQRHAPVFFPRNELVIIWKGESVVGLQGRSGRVRNNCQSTGSLCSVIPVRSISLYPLRHSYIIVNNIG